jgi:hypothetical protein
METLGKHKGIAGSWAPLNDLSFEWAQLRQFIPAEVFTEISGANLAALLGIRGEL